MRTVAENNSSIRFAQHVERLFIPADAYPVLAADGLTAQPSQRRIVPQGEWATWSDIPCLVLLGDPSIGKSTEFAHQLLRCRGAGQAAYLTRWNEWHEGTALLELVDDPEAFRSALDSGEPVTWFVDSLDEGRLQSAAAFGQLLTTLRQLQARGHLGQLSLRISCRASDWRAADQAALERLFSRRTSSPSGIVALRLLPLTEPAVRMLAGERLSSPAEVDRFMASMRIRHVTTLAGHPLILAMMLAEYSETRQLSADRTTIYAMAVERLVLERNETRLDAAPAVTSREERIRAVEETAARLVLGGHSLLAWPERVQGPSVLDADRVPVARNELRDALETGLFVRLADGSYEFFHRSFAEFMAAKRLARGMVDGASLKSVLPLFPVEHGGVPTPLREMAAWLAGMDIRFQSWLVREDPATACLGDTLRYTPQNRLDLLHVLADQYKDRKWQNEFDRFGDLAATLPESELRQLLRRSNGPAVRMMAVNMLETATRPELHALLLEVALDDLEDPEVRTRSVMILAAAAPAQFAERLAPLLALDVVRDPEDEIAGAVLHQLYPDNLTTDRALVALRVPRRPNTYGLFRLFWSRLFLERLPADIDSRKVAMQALRSLLAGTYDVPGRSALVTAGHDPHHLPIVVQPLVGILAELVRRDLSDDSRDMTQTGPCLVVLSEWIQRFGHAELAAPLIMCMKESMALRREILEWCIGVLPLGRILDPWELPFLGQSQTADDIEMYAALCRAHAQDARLSIPLFQHLLQLTFQFPSAGPLELIEDVASHSETLLEEWALRSHCNLESNPLAASRRYAKEIEAQRFAAQSGVRQRVLANLEEMRAGNGDLITQVLWEAGGDFFDASKLQRVQESFGPEALAAITEGLFRAWETFCDVSMLWRARDTKDPQSLPMPNDAIVAALGFRLDARSIGDLHWLSDAQVECVLWLCLRGDGEWLPLFRRIWLTRPLVVWSRLENLLAEEAEQGDNYPALLWGRLAVMDDPPGDLVTHIWQFVRQRPIARNARVRISMYAFARRHVARAVLVAGLLAPLRVHAERTWVVETVTESAIEYAEIAVIAMVWLLEPAFIEGRGSIIFSGPRHRARALGFVTAVLQITAPATAIAATWDRSITFEDYANLLPHLFYESSATAQDVVEVLDMPLQLALDARNRLVSHIASAPPVDAQAWFASWRQDLRFGQYRDWISALHTQATRQLADAQWRPLTPLECDAVLLRKGMLVKTASDAALYLDELIETRVSPSFRTDHALTPLLWGKKSGGTRQHEDEKALQTAVYASMRQLMLGMPIVGAREPEQFDAKKPDLRFGFFVEDQGTVEIPLEMKWSDNAGLWTAPKEQLLGKYMVDPAVRHGLYVVAWAGASTLTRGPGESPATPMELQQRLQQVSDAATKGTDKSIGVHVLDMTMPT